jgi:hypothetical protein
LQHALSHQYALQVTAEQLYHSQILAETKAQLNVLPALAVMEPVMVEKKAVQVHHVIIMVDNAARIVAALQDMLP